MKKQDIIRIINEEIEFALEEQEKQLYKVVDDEGNQQFPDKSSEFKGLLKKIATKLAAKNPKWSVKKINEMYDPIYDTMLPEILVMISAGVIGVKKAIKYLKEKGLDKQDIIDVIKKAKSKLDESLEATNKKTGKDVTKHVNDYMAGDIDKKEFEKLTGLKKESVNEATKHTIVVYNGKRLAVEPGDIERLKSGKDVVGNSTKHAGQEEWIQAKGKWKIEESLEATIQKLFKSAKKKLGMTKTTSPSDEEFKYAVEWVIDEYGKDHNIWSIGVDDIQDRIYLEVGEDKTNVSEEFWIDRPSHLSESVNENEGMKKSLKDIDPSLSLTKYDTTPPSFKVTYIRKDDMSKEMEEELVAWVLSKGGRVDSVETMFDVEDGERYYYPYVKFSYK